jgi:hypothetical protein
MSPKSFIRTWAPLGVASLTACAVGCGSASEGGGSQYGAPNSGTSGDVSTEDASTDAPPSGESSGAVSASGSSGTGSSGSSTGSSSGLEDDSGSTTAPSTSGASDESGSVAETGPIEHDAGPGVDSGMDDCAGGKTGTDSSGTRSDGGYGDVEFSISTATQITGLYTTLAVPALPPPSGTLFLWPGLQPLPNGKNYNPIGNGVLQPVLTWGSTCAPTAPNDYMSWWISAQYVNTYSSYMGHTGCLGGEGMNVAVGDQLDIAMTLSGTVWTQVVTDRQTAKSVNFSLDMLGQSQNWGLFQIEVPTGREPVSDVIFTSTKITMAAADAAACQPSARGTNDYYSAPQSSVDGKTCCVSKIILRGKGVAATSPNTP